MSLSTSDRHRSTSLTPPQEDASESAPSEITASARSVTAGGAGRGAVRGRWWFLLLCFGWSWLSLLAAKAAGLSLMGLPVQLATVAMVPALTAVIVRRFTREGFADAGLRLRLRETWRYYLVALALPLGVFLVGTALALVTGAADPQRVPAGEVAVTALTGPVLALVAAPLFWGEEFGWTSYLRDRLLPGRTLATTFATGLIWGVWHFPLPWVGYFGDGVPAGQLALSMLLWVPLSILLEYLIGWLWERTGSIWPGALLHAGCNLGAAVGLEKVLAGQVSTPLQTTLYCAALTPFVAWVVIRQAAARRAAGSPLPERSRGRRGR